VIAWETGVSRVAVDLVTPALSEAGEAVEPAHAAAAHVARPAWVDLAEAVREVAEADAADDAASARLIGGTNETHTA
jgi:hypothetical protein